MFVIGTPADSPTSAGKQKLPTSGQSSGNTPNVTVKRKNNTGQQFRRFPAREELQQPAGMPCALSTDVKGGEATVFMCGLCYLGHVILILMGNLQ